MATDECDCMNVCYKNMKNKVKEWHHATKYLMFSSSSYLRRYPFALSGKLTIVIILQLAEPLPRRTYMLSST